MSIEGELFEAEKTHVYRNADSKLQAIGMPQQLIEQLKTLDALSAEAKEVESKIRKLQAISVMKHSDS